MSFSKPHKRAAFSIIELMLALMVLAILAQVSVTYFSDTSDGQRFEQTRQKVDTLRSAILGDDTVDNEGRRKNFGYHGDMGKLPSTLSDLVAQGAQNAWSFSTYHGFGSGWRGPYVHSGFTGGAAVTHDEWGKTFVYSTALNPPSLTSLGADNKAGGTGTDSDIQTQFSFAQRMATVKGIVAMNNVRLSNQSVQIRYPSAVSSLQTFQTQVSDANGYFTFSSIPFGVRSLMITGPGALVRPIPIVVDTSDYQVPTSLLNLGQTVAYVSGTVTSTGAGDATVQASIASSYPQSLQIQAITFTWTSGGATRGFIKRFQMGGTYESLTPVASGTRVVFNNLLSLPSQQSGVNIVLTMCDDADGTNTFDTDGYTFTLIFEWKGIPKKDTVVFTVS